MLAEEMAKIGARNPIGGMGVMMFGPTLLEVGTEEQKKRHIPPIVKGELRWCQGYSEPGSGSDLASLQTRCEDKGDHWLINGSKIPGPRANFADWCFCLVRTDTTKKQEGISFVLIYLRTPGVETRPILLINGTSPFCETFFTDVKAPKENLMGPLNGGWTIAKRLLQFERDNISTGLGGAGPASPAMGGPPSGVVALARKYVGLDAAGRLDDADLRKRIIEHTMETRAFQLTVQRAATRGEVQSGAERRRTRSRNTPRSQDRPGPHRTLDRSDGPSGAGLGGREVTTRANWARPAPGCAPGQLHRGRHFGSEP